MRRLTFIFFTGRSEMLTNNLSPLHKAVVLAAIVVGCSSSADSGDNNGAPGGQGGGFGFGGTNGFGGFGAFAGNSNPPPVTCGNGQVDQGEECDGSTTATCESATLGARPTGTVSCNSCRVDTSLCTSSNPGGGATGTGGGLGTGGGVGTGGGLNMGGYSSGGGGEPIIPAPSGTCQNFVTGDMTFKGQQVKVWAGAPSGHGPLVIYWYATGSSVAEVNTGLGQAAINDITSQGGVVAAMYKTTATGNNTGDYVWYTGDFDITDEVVACAVQQQHIDTHRIYSIGFSAGGLQSGIMAFLRSNYMASVVTYSGGALNTTLQDPNNMPAVMCQHGDKGSDVVIIDFSDASAALEQAVRSHGVFAMDCNHGGGHMIPYADVASSWQFMKDHPYKVNPEPYAGGIPAGFPSYCKIVP